MSRCVQNLLALKERFKVESKSFTGLDLTQFTRAAKLSDRTFIFAVCMITR